MKEQIVKMVTMAEKYEGLTRKESIKKLAGKLEREESIIIEDYIKWVMENPN